MTPKEKAVAFVQAFIDEGFLPAAARIAALIAVDEIIEALKNNAANSASWLYYEEVKQEIEAL
jgi:hypothetical protein